MNNEKYRCNYLHKKGLCKRIVKEENKYCSYHKNNENKYYYEPSFIYNLPNINKIPYPRITFFK